MKDIALCLELPSEQGQYYYPGASDSECPVISYMLLFRSSMEKSITTSIQACPLTRINKKRKTEMENSGCVLWCHHHHGLSLFHCIRISLRLKFQKMEEKTALYIYATDILHWHLTYNLEFWISAMLLLCLSF